MKKPAAISETVSRDELNEMRRALATEIGQPIFLGNDKKLKLRILPTGLAPLDAMLGGGLAFDRITLVIGEFSSGKTLLALMAIKSALKQNLLVAYIDGEKTWTPEWAEQLGIDTSKVIVARPHSGEDAFNVAIALVKRGLGLLVIDSLASLRPRDELGGDDGEAPEGGLMQRQFMGNHAKMIGRGLADIVAENKGTAVICINQLRDKVGISYGSPETLPGGRGQQYFAWQIVRVRRQGWIEEGTGKAKHRVGYHVGFKTEKSKQNSPFQECSIPFRFSGEFDELSGLIDVGIELGAIRAEPPNYYIAVAGAEEKFYGRARLLEAVKARPELQEAIRNVEAAIPLSDL